ncbi:CAMK/CAMKL/CHK1 protein kinase [Nannizzia gypsea CBS 118893]|uniref:non-specific serine/threonine protein kinase n=1 Tax=Arthroderma gypseum (strain ATCC MYA-4604 / CBS 118893) TaxID=535722 RepID=E5QZU4_ARTGP|nr:CAMK/CAMKL/CHK1 protein kinase [Nannizzia gypsea CBS 118893]EFQ97407.1 CAMK/CAMKL/CHK1 protein kinase [Nannizzia gypsea CBS 118893]
MKHSQLAPLPDNLPFRIVSRTIGQGAYACIKKGCPTNADAPIFAVKFIHKEYAAKHGHISAKQLQMEVALHKHIGSHQNIIEFYNTGENEAWRWIAMELAEGGDLFDKIEADEGVGEDIAHVYFSQLVSAVGFMHSKGVGHRDIKPENILLSADGNLKIADFGLATLFEYGGKLKLNTTLCGSPPYIAPEVIRCSNRGHSKGQGYRADIADAWSCGIVLFVLLVGNTPWDSPTDESYEFCDYVKSNSRPSDELWNDIPSDALSLLRGMLKLDVNSRFNIDDIRRHPWFTRQNKHYVDGKLVNPVKLATTMFESLHIDFSQDPLSSSQSRSQPGGSDPMDIDPETTDDLKPKFSATQPETPIDAGLMDWDGPPRLTTGLQSASQPKEGITTDQAILLAEQLLEEPSMSQFCATPSVPLSRTQNAQRFQDIVPASGLTRFFSTWSTKALVSRICEALQLLHVPAAPKMSTESVLIRLRTSDDRKCPLHGNILIETVSEGLVEVEFVKIKGDPLEWRRFFKKITILCKDAVMKPDQ